MIPDTKMSPDTRPELEDMSDVVAESTVANSAQKTAGSGLTENKG